MDARNTLRLAGTAAGYLLHRRVGIVENLACAGLSAGVSSATAAYHLGEHFIFLLCEYSVFAGVGGIDYDYEQLSGVFPDSVGLAG